VRRQSEKHAGSQVAAAFRRQQRESHAPRYSVIQHAHAPALRQSRHNAATAAAVSLPSMPNIARVAQRRHRTSSEGNNAAAVAQ